MKNPPSAVAQTNIPRDIRRRLVESLFADSRSLVIGAAFTCFGALVITALTRNWGLAAVTMVILAVVGVRLRLIRDYQTRARRHDLAEVKWLERTYVLGATAFLFSVGLMNFVVFATSDDPFILILSVSGALAHAFSIAVRNFAIRTGVGLQIWGLAIPLGAAFLVKGGLIPLLIPLVLAPICLFVYGSASRLRDILLSEIGFRNQSEKIARQFDFAINNMSHGMCMISSDGRILVSNAKFADFLGFNGRGRLENVRLYALLRIARRRGSIPRDALERMTRLLDLAAIQGEPCSTQLETASDLVFEITLTPNSSGSWVVVVQDVTAKRDADRAIDRMAHFDSVTNLRNRRSFELALAKSLESAGARLDVMFLDLDDFKQVNDSLGHRTGDKLLAEIARRLRIVIDVDDVVARWGGDEFVILHRPGPGRTDIAVLAKRIIEEVARPVMIDGSEVIVGASIGSASAPEHGVTADALLSNADIALYAAKADGRRGWRAFQRSMDAKVQVRRLVELELRAAVATSAFDVDFQPIVDVKTRKIVAFEALARWRHPVRGPVPPAEFIPILEEIGLMEEFGASVMRRACAACAGWPEDISVSVNLSSSQFRSGAIEKTIHAALKAAKLSPRRLDIEITESTLLDDCGDTRRALRALRARGVRISLDDFGTGYSSLSYLLSFPLDRIKIDRSFTIGLGVHERAAILVESVAAMACKLGMSVLIEGVETERQLQVIQDLGTVNEAQGYLFSPPVLQSKVASLLGMEARTAA